PPIRDLHSFPTRRSSDLASVGAAFAASDRLRFSTQVDWTDWSRVDKIVIKFREQAGLNQVYNVDFHDNFALHAGGEYKATPTLRSEEHTSELQSRGHLVC